MAKKGKTRSKPGAGRRPANSLGVDAPEIDPEGWMAERPRYWLDLSDSEPPTPMAWLRHRAREALALLGAPAPNPWAQLGADDAAWRRLSESALGKLPPAPGEATQRRPKGGKPVKAAKASTSRQASAPAKKMPKTRAQGAARAAAS